MQLQDVIPRLVLNLLIGSTPVDHVIQLLTVTVVALPVFVLLLCLGLALRKREHRYEYLTRASGIVFTMWGVLLFVVGLGAQFWIVSVNHQMSVQLVRPLVAFVSDLWFQWAPMVFTAGIALLGLHFGRFKLNIAYLTLTAGLSATVLGWRIVQLILTFGKERSLWTLFSAAYIVYSAVGPSLILAGLMEVLLVERISSSKVAVATRLDYVATLSLIVTASVGILSLFSMLQVLGVALLAWVLWHFLSLPIAVQIVEKRLSREGILVLRPERASVHDSSFLRVVRRSLLLIALTANVTPWLIRYVGPEVANPLQYGSLMVHYSWYILPTLGVLLGPVKWLIEETGISRCDSKKWLFEPLQIPSVLRSLVGVTAFLSVGIAAYELANDIPTGVAVFFLIFVTTLPSALLATFAYAKLSMPSLAARFKAKLTDRAILQSSESVSLQHFSFCCPGCGTTLAANARYCSNCGASIH